MIAYRTEIDGLRAIAVLAMSVYHAGFINLVPGGYVEVDVFFVISGYLITSLIESDITSKTFSLKYFYERRCRRLLPALFLVLACNCIAAIITCCLTNWSSSGNPSSLYFSPLRTYSSGGKMMAILLD